MSFGAGGLAQMTYQSPFNNTNIGVSGPGFASRGKGSHIKRLSVAPPPKISTIDETQQVNAASTPRTSRGHMLAGLRTAPKSATVAPTQSGLESSKYADPQYNAGSRAPQTTTSAYFPNGRNMNGSYQNYAQPEQILAPPAIDWNGQVAEGIDQDLYDELVATNNFLAQQQRALQQQLLSITQTAQQFGNMNITPSYGNSGQPYQSPAANTPISLYRQQCQQGMQPIVQPVPGNPGVFAVYNPMTGQSSFIFDNGQQEPVEIHNNYTPISPQSAPPFQRQLSDPAVPLTDTRSISPPKLSTSPPKDVEPLPPPSANAFRRGHRKNLSSVNIKTNGEWTRGAGPRSSILPPTPMTGSFGPGHGRAGEHPVRQPRGPPLLQELEEKPTAKHEGSKNFATRQRRRAVHNLVRAGRERRNDSCQPGSGAGTPSSENDFNFSVSSDNDSVLAGSTSLTSRASLGSLHASSSGTIGAIGCERKEKSRERSSVDSSGQLSAKSLSSDEGNAVGGPYVEVEPARRNTPLLVLSSAEKRRSVVV